MDATHASDWGLEAVVRSCCSAGWAAVDVPGTEAVETLPVSRPETLVGAVAPYMELEFVAETASPLYNVPEYLDLEQEQLPPAPFSITPSSPSSCENEVLISFGAASTSEKTRPATTRKQAGMKPAARAPRRPKRSKSKKSQVKKVVREVPVADGGVTVIPDDPWAWRKYGQKPIKGSPYPRGYYKCSSLKACTARKLVDRSLAKPGVLVITYIAHHCHAVPTDINQLAATARNPPKSPLTDDDTAKREDDSAEVSSSLASNTGADGESDDLWTMAMDDIFGVFDDDFDSIFCEGEDR